MAADPDIVAEIRSLRALMIGQQWETLRAAPRALEPLRLTPYGHKTFSQNDEDGLILEIFNRIGMRDRRFIEFGVEHGAQCNTLLLLSAGWNGLWLDGSTEHVAEIGRRHTEAIAEGRLTALEAFVTAENIDNHLSVWAGGAPHSPAEIDLLSIDIDRNDYWVWMAIVSVRPRVVVIEYNASYPPPVEFVVPYQPQARWDGKSSYFGASLSALERLGREKGYALVGCCLAGVNALFVREDELEDADGAPRFHAPFTAREHYEPPRYFLSSLAQGHRPKAGPNGAPGLHAAARRSP